MMTDSVTTKMSRCYYENVEVCIITLTGNIAVQMEQNFLIGVKTKSNHDISTIMTIVEINKSAIMEKENTIIFK